jgi:hypothetical protein
MDGPVLSIATSLFSVFSHLLPNLLALRKLNAQKGSVLVTPNLKMPSVAMEQN